MKKLLNLFFASTEFWQKFEVVNEYTTVYSYSVSYKLMSKFDDILIKFYELQGVKCFSVVQSRKTIIESLYFLNHDDLNLLLNRIPQIRAANPLCSGSLSIKALSLSLQNENKTHH